MLRYALITLCGLLVVGSAFAQVASEVYVPAEMVTVAATPMSSAEVEKLKQQVAQQNVVINRLSKHLESALARLNDVSGASKSPKTEILLATKAKLENENVVLKRKLSAAQTELAQTTKREQLLDLENRQLFHALNGAPKQVIATAAAPMEVGQSDRVASR